MVPLVYFTRSDGGLMIIASNGGSCTHPAWYYNLKAHPKVTVELGTERFRVVAEELDSEARSLVWPTIVEQSPAAGEFPEDDHPEHSCVRAHSRRLTDSEEQCDTC